MFVTYDPNQGFPQAAQLGRGIVERQTSRDGNGKIVETLVHTPPDGLSSFEVAGSDLVHGTDERFYQVVSGPTLEAKPQADIDAILAPEKRQSLEAHAFTIAEEKRRSVLAAAGAVGADNPQIPESARRSFNESLNGRATAKTHRSAEGRGKAGEDQELAQLEGQADLLEPVDKAMVSEVSKIKAGDYDATDRHTAKQQIADAINSAA